MKIKTVPLTKESFAPFGTFVTYGAMDDGKEAMAYLPDIGAFELNSPVAGMGVLFADPQAADMNEMEYHEHTEEGWIILDGECVAAVGTPCADPNEAEYTAFKFPAKTQVSLKTGVWHFAPIPCGDKRTTVLCILPPNTPENDIIVKPLKETLSIEK